MNVLMISPAYPGEMPRFTRALAATGARVVGLSDQPRRVMAEDVQRALTAHLRVQDLWDEAAVVDVVRREVAASGTHFHRVECLWEPGMVLAARLREALDVPGMTVEQTVPFRDKEVMKQVLDAAGIRTPWHARARTSQEVRDAAERAGRFPLIIKPIAGAGSLNTYRVDGMDEVERVLPALGGVEQVSVEEFIDGDEFTYDTVCADGRILYENIGFYRPRPLDQKKYEHVSPSCVCVRNLDDPQLEDGRRMGHAVIEALGFQSGFTHMEWYRTAEGEVVFGEIGARPAGAHLVEAMNYVSDIDLYTGWAEAVCHGRFSQTRPREYNAAIVFKRARGQGRIQEICGLDRLRAELGPAICAVELLPIGSPRRDWQSSAVSDGFLIVRHPELQATFGMVDRIARELEIRAG